MPAFKNHTGKFGIPNVIRSIPTVKSFNDGFVPYFEERNLQITGITKDSTGAALGECRVVLYDKLADLYQAEIISDVNGNFTLQIPKGLSQPQTTTWYLVAYKPGVPDVAGTTVNTLIGA